jgi:thiamine biosynthesis lipoprotein
MRKPLLLFLAIAFIFFPSFLIRAQEQTELKMGTFVTIKLQGYIWSDFDSAFNEAFLAIDNVESIASIYKNDSEISRLNEKAYREAVVVSKELFSLIKDSLALSKDSDGAFDITVGPLVKLWRGYREKKSLPYNGEIEEALSAVGYKNIIIDEPKRTVRFLKKGTSLDLSSIGKGHAVDSAVEALKRCGFHSAIVNAGGDIYCLGRKNIFSRWSIGILDPQDNARIIKRLYVSDKAVSTSGGYQQYFTYKGKDYSHIIDPRTGYPVKKNRSFSVTVTAPYCAVSNRIATATCVGGEALKNKLEGKYPSVDIIINENAA